MKEWIAVAVLLYSVPLFALLLTWKKPLWQALRGIVLSEVLGILCFFPLYALVGMLSWQWFRWGGVSLQEMEGRRRHGGPVDWPRGGGDRAGPAAALGGGDRPAEAGPAGGEKRAMTEEVPKGEEASWS